MNLFAIIFIISLFAILMGFFSQDKVDYFPFALIIGIVAVLFMLHSGIERDEILGFINYNTLIFIFAIQIIIYYLNYNKILEYSALKLIHITKGNNRVFFYLICIFTALIVAFIEDLSLALILAPLIYRTCRILDIPAGTYMMGMTITINIGAILTPVSSIKNLIISQEFGWGFLEFFINMGPIFLIALLLTIFLLDRFVLRKEEKPTEENKQLLLDVINPNMVIDNKFYFSVTYVILIATFGLMFFGFEPALVALISAALLLIIHSRVTNFQAIKSEITWRILIAFAVIFILSNSLASFGFADLISDLLLDVIGNNIYLAVLIVLLISSVLSAFLAGTPVTIILLPIVAAVAGESLFPNPIIIAFIGGVNMAGNFLPQGSACDLLTLNLARKYNVENLNYRRLLKYGGTFAILHFLIILGYTMLYTLFLC